MSLKKELKNIKSDINRLENEVKNIEVGDVDISSDNIYNTSGELDTNRTVDVRSNTLTFQGFNTNTPTAASGVLTYTGVPSNGDTITINGVQIHFTNSLTANDTDQILISGLSAAIEVASLTNDLLNSGQTTTTQYIKHTSIPVSSSFSGGDVTVTANSTGYDGNYAVSSETDEASWDGKYLTGGESADSEILVLETDLVKLGEYGRGDKTGTVAYHLAVDEDGKVIESTGGGTTLVDEDYITIVEDTDGSGNYLSHEVIDDSTGKHTIFTMEANSFNLIGNQGSPVGLSSFSGEDSSPVTGDNQFSVWVDDSGTRLGYSERQSAGYWQSQRSIAMLTTGIEISDSGGVGAEYAADYSSGYSDRSLVDKAYADTKAVNPAPSQIRSTTVVTLSGVSTTVTLDSIDVDLSGDEYTIDTTNNKIVFDGADGSKVFEVKYLMLLDVPANGGASRSTGIGEARLDGTVVDASISWNYVREYQGGAESNSTDVGNPGFLIQPTVDQELTFSALLDTGTGTATRCDLYSVNIVIKRIA